MQLWKTIAMKVKDINWKCLKLNKVVHGGHIMDWNKNGRIDASDVLITELFQKELDDNKKIPQENLNVENNDNYNEKEKR